MAVSGAGLWRVLETLRASGFGDIAGARVTATVPLTEELLNEIIAACLPAPGAIRTLTVHPRADNRLGVRVKFARPEFAPPLSATLALERQPQLPAHPQFELRVMGLPGLLAFAAPLVSIQSLLPPGIHLERDRVRVDLAALLLRHGQADLLGYLEDFRLTAEAGRLLIDVRVVVPESAKSRGRPGPTNPH